MKIYKTQREVEEDIKDGVLAINGDVKFECNININADITAENITALGIEANNIKSGGIKAFDINAENITARDIDAVDIKSGDIKSGGIDARDITAGDIKAWSIKARNIFALDIIALDISYYALCLAYHSIKCKSWKAGRDSHKEPICLDGELIIKEDEVEIIVDGNKTMISRESAKALNLIK